MSDLISLSPVLLPGSSAPNFVNLDQSLVCVECHKVLQDPFQTACGHRICHHCLEELFIREGDSVSCPAGEETCEYLTRNDGVVNTDFFARKQLKKLLVYCPFKVNGCEEVVPWSQLQIHTKQCKYASVVCPNKIYGCKELLPHTNLQEHVKKCPFRRTQCDDCGEYILVTNIHVHKTQECRHRRVDCPNKCGSKNILQKELEAHLKICTKKLKSCQYQAFGCEFKGTESDHAKHHKDAMENHLALVATVAGQHEVDKMQLENVIHENSLIRKELIRKGLEINELKQRQEELMKLQPRFDATLQRLSKLESKQRDTNDATSETRKVVIELQETMRDMAARLFSVETQGGTANSFRNKTNERQVSQVEHELGILSMRVADIDNQQTILTEANYAGKLTWRIDNYYQRKKEASSGRSPCITSKPFYAGQYGYKMCARAYLNGDGAGKNSHLSLFFVIMKGKFDPILMWPFQQKVTFMLMDQTNGGNHIIDTFRPDSNSGSFQKPTSDANIASGFPLFIPHRELEAKSSPYLKDGGTLFIKVKVDMSDLYDV